MCCPATKALTCVDLQSLGSALGQLTVSQIEALDEADVYSCVDTLGGQSKWTDDQTTALLSRFKQVSRTRDLSQTVIISLIVCTVILKYYVISTHLLNKCYS